MTPMGGSQLDPSAVLGMVGQGQRESPDVDGIAKEVRGDIQQCADALTRISKAFPQVKGQTDQMIEAMSNLYMDILSSIDQQGSQAQPQPQML